MAKLLCLCVLLGVLSCEAKKSLPMPSYITPCSRNEVDLNACVTKRGRETIPHIIGGDKKYKIPVLDPLVVAGLHVDQGVLGLTFNATNLVFTGLRNTIINDIKWDPVKRRAVYDMTMPRLEIDCHYDIDGRILILPITGSGRGNITLMNVSAVYFFNFDYVKKDGGNTYILPKSGTFNLDTTRMYVYLDNLFNGNKLLGDELNTFMDENWRDMVKDLSPVIGQSMGEVMRRILKNVFDLVDYDHALPDTPV